MSKAVAVRFEPRKTPLQARSTASVGAILQATIQVLLKEGKAKLTTTRIAQRAGVSVGTLYQYFPNKSSLLQTILKEHLERVAVAVEDACEASRGASLAKMAAAVTSAFLQAKFRDIDTSSVLYSISDDVDGALIVRGMHARATQAMASLFRTASGKEIAEPDAVAAILLSAMAGVSRTLLERGATGDTMRVMEKELTLMVRAYLEASPGDACVPQENTNAAHPTRGGGARGITKP